MKETSNQKHSLRESWWHVGFEGNSGADTGFSKGGGGGVELDPRNEKLGGGGGGGGRTIPLASPFY